MWLRVLGRPRSCSCWLQSAWMHPIPCQRVLTTHREPNQRLKRVNPVLLFENASILFGMTVAQVPVVHLTIIRVLQLAVSLPLMAALRCHSFNPSSTHGAGIGRRNTDLTRRRGGSTCLCACRRLASSFRQIRQIASVLYKWSWRKARKLRLGERRG